MGGKGGGGTTTTQTTIPPELQALFANSATHVRNLQDYSPQLINFTREGQPQGAFRTAPQSGYFGNAATGVGQSRAIAQQGLAGRKHLGSRPQGTTDAIGTAKQAQRQATRVPSQFGNLVGVANERVGLQELEKEGVRTARGVSRYAQQVPGAFGNTLNTFNRGIDPLRQFAQQTPQEYQQTLQGFQQGVDPLQGYAQQVSGTFGDTRQQAGQDIRDVIGQADRQVTGANIQQDPAYNAAIQSFESAILPQVQNSAQLAGLGRSTGLQQSLAQAQAQYLLPVVQETLAREERGIDRGLGARQFGTQVGADLGIQQGLAEERGVQRGTDIGQFGLATAADLGLAGAQAKERGIERGTGIGQFGLQTGAQLGLEQGYAGERGLERRSAADQFAAGLASDTGARQAQRQENRIGRRLDATLQQGLAGERGIERGQAASQFLSGQQQAAGQQDLQRLLEGIGVDERSRALQYDQAQRAFDQRFQLGQQENQYRQGQLDRNTQDFLRRQALAESALYQPFGSFVPSALGQTSSSSGKK